MGGRGKLGKLAGLSAGQNSRLTSLGDPLCWHLGLWGLLLLSTGLSGVGGDTSATTQACGQQGLSQDPS